MHNTILHNASRVLYLSTYSAKYVIGEIVKA